MIEIIYSKVVPITKKNYSNQEDIRKKERFIMFSAVMKYQFKPDNVEQACRIWRETILPGALGREGLVSMQLYSDKQGTAYAFGTWQNQQNAVDFMETGIFKELLSALDPFLQESPVQQKWTLQAYIEKDQLLFNPD